jgi:hypothetical protein
MTEFDRMIQLLDSCWYLRSEIVPCLVGPPGIGKTAAVELHAKNHGAKVVKIIASRCIPSEIVGMTMPNNESRSMDIYNSRQLTSLRDGDILFLDELLEADQFVLSTLLTLIESREMADGTPLPDIQIVAATNDTIPSDQLRDNIKQRFMFMRFNLDSWQVHEYIKERTGLDHKSNTTQRIRDKSGGRYNFLSPRSLTKLAMWMAAVPSDKVRETEGIINDMWDSLIGTCLADARIERDKGERAPIKQARRAIIELVDNNVIDVHAFGGHPIKDCTMSELMDILTNLPNWEQVKSALETLDIEDSEEEDKPIEY